MNSQLFDLNVVKSMIENGKKLILAGDENVLGRLPQGEWIGGTIPYFVSEKGGEFSQEQIYVTELPTYALSASIVLYDEKTIHEIYNDGPQNGFSFVIMPASSPTHFVFALNAPTFPNFVSNPLIGWVSGTSLQAVDATAKVFDGSSGQAFENAAVAFHVVLPAEKIVDIGIINIFEQDAGDVLVFDEDGFSVGDVKVNGETVNFADYLSSHQVDTKLPLVANLYGANINTSFEKVDAHTKRVNFFAPVFAGQEYHIARPVKDYVDVFHTHVPADVGDNLFFSCNCILNYLYAELNGKPTGNFTGPVTFGEIAYQLLNQTLAYLTISDAEPMPASS